MTRPTPDELLRYSLGLLDPDRARAVEAFVNSSPEAQQMLVDARRQHEALTRAYEGFDSGHEFRRAQLMASLPEVEAPAGVRRLNRGLQPAVRGLRYAAIIALCVAGLWMIRPSRRELPQPAEPTFSAALLQQKKAELRLALGLTHRQLLQAEQAALQDVMGDQLVPALRRIPINWSVVPKSADRETGV